VIGDRHLLVVYTTLHLSTKGTTEDRLRQKGGAMKTVTVVVLLLLVEFSVRRPAMAFSMSSSSSSSARSDDRMLYGVANSGWSSPKWNWGSAVGTGHDCARICRQKFSTRQARQELVQNLVGATTETATTIDFEEVKLVLALSWQKGRWDGSDGGRGGYGEVLESMAEAKRYEQGSEVERSQRLVQDMQARYNLLQPTPKEADAMASLNCEGKHIYEARCRCAGLVLQSMGFVENGC